MLILLSKNILLRNQHLEDHQSIVKNKNSFLILNLGTPFKYNVNIKTPNQLIIFKILNIKQKTMQSMFQPQNIQQSNFNESIALLQQQSKAFNAFQTLDLDVSQTQKKSKKQKSIVKKRTRVMKNNSRWTFNERIQHFKALIRFNIQKTNIGLSWTFWKPQKIFNYIESKIKTKSSAQIKSFDLRMKKQYLEGPNHLDLIPAALFQLQKVKQEDQQARQLIQAHKNLQKIGSSYMEVIKKKSKQLSQIDSLIQKLKDSMNMYQSKGQVENIFIDQE